MPSHLRVLCAAKLHANQLERHLELLELLDDVAELHLVRHAPLSGRLSKLKEHIFTPRSLPQDIWRMYWLIRRVIREEKIDWVVAFNPVPWGAVAAAAAKAEGVPCSLSLIGMDFLQVQSWWGGAFLHAIRGVESVTVTGQAMVDGLVQRGVDERKITILPHSVDTERFRPREVERQFDIVSVGQLIHRKRMSVLIEALALLKARGTSLRLGILGKGPEKDALLEQIQASQLSQEVQLLGYVDDVEQFLPSAEVFALVSSWEGVPFAMIEAMASGLVPVVTDVGTISDWVTAGETGEIVPVDDAPALAQVLEELFVRDRPRLEAMRDRGIAIRDRYSLKEGVGVWRKIFTTES
ncbi:MAG: glycosyltransferase family 4 protein [Polyangiaceae bacterium]|nr:glycosyltransferase family 4 protein [Polyangiaceae bacterium]